MKKTNKYYNARTKADLSFQFYRDKEGTPNFLITSNAPPEGKNLFYGLNASIFADNLIDSGLCSVNELVFLCGFFDRVRDRMQLKVAK